MIEKYNFIIKSVQYLDHQIFKCEYRLMNNVQMRVFVFKENFLLFHLFKTIEVRLGILVELLGFMWRKSIYFHAILIHLIYI